MSCNETLKALFYHHVKDAEEAVKNGKEELYQASVEDMGELVELSKEFDPELAKEFEKVYKKYNLKPTTAELDLKKAVKALVVSGQVSLAEELNKSLEKPIPTTEIQISTDLPTEKVERIKTEFSSDAINAKTFADFQELISKVVVTLQLEEKDREHIAAVLNKIRELAELEKI